MRVIVFGATGKVGRLLVAELLQRGHTVTAFIHNQKLAKAAQLQQVRGDVYDRDSVEAALKDQDVIVSALGSWGTKQKNVVSSGMQKIVPAAETAGISRLVSLTGYAPAPGDKPGLLLRAMVAGGNLFAPKIVRDGQDHIAILAASSLNWTVLRSGVMTRSDNVRYSLSARSGNLFISRHAVVQAMADLIENNEWPMRAPFIRRG